MTNPDVSVVMSVYNGAQSLPRTMQSMIDQQGGSFEFIVVNDGSTDSSGRVLDGWAARDSRLQVIHQANTGLTRALIRGCAEARGEFIARQDCGDQSLPGRLSSQVKAMRSAPDAVMVACGARFLGPAGETLHDVVTPSATLHAGLALLDVKRIKGPPHHGGTLFRRADYEAVGGYRPPFVVAQDIDLWLRLWERGRCIGQDEVCYLASVEAGSISGRRRKEQFRMATLAIECAKARRDGTGDEAALNAMSAIPVEPRKNGPATPRELARFYYFVGSCLRHTNPSDAKRYFRHALSEQPFFLRALWRHFLG